MTRLSSERPEATISNRPSPFKSACEGLHIPYYLHLQKTTVTDAPNRNCSRENTTQINLGVTES